MWIPLPSHAIASHELLLPVCLLRYYCSFVFLARGGVCVLVVLPLLLLAVVLGFSSCVDFWGESLVCWARSSSSLASPLGTFPARNTTGTTAAHVGTPWYNWHTAGTSWYTRLFWLFRLVLFGGYYFGPYSVKCTLRRWESISKMVVAQLIRSQ